MKYGVDKDGVPYYAISSVDDLKVLSAYVNSGNDCADFTFKATANIDISDVAVMNNFAGTFDGGGHLLTNAAQNIFGGATVSNLYYHGTATIDDATKVYTLELPAGVTATGDDIYLTTEGGVIYIKAGGTVTLNFDTGKLTINGQTVTGGTYQLTMPDEDISVEFTEGDFMANQNPQTPQEAIQKFMASLVNHGYAYSYDIDTAMLNSAVQAASRFTSIQDVIDQMMADQVAAEKEAVEEVLGSDYAGKTLAEVAEIDSSILSANAKDYDTANISNAYYNSSNDGRSTVENFIKERKALIFLEKYCGIQLNTKLWLTSTGGVNYWSGDTTGNVDTGAITGSDANITLKVGDVVNGTTLTAENLSTLATAYGNRAQLVGDTLTIGTGTEKTERSVVSETLINTYTATTNAAQIINTGTRNWVVKATDKDDTITSDGADSINAGGGNDLVTVNSNGATVTSGEGADTVEISAQVKNVTLTDLNADDQMTISGTFEVGAVKVEDMMLVITDKTGTRQIKLGDFENAVNSTVNVSGASQKISDWLTESGIDLNHLTAAENTAYSDKWLASDNVSGNDNIGVEDGRIAPDASYTPTPVEESETSTAQPETVKEKAILRSSANTAGGPITVNLDNVDTSAVGNVQVDGQNVGTLSSTFPEGTTTFTRNGLTIHLLGRSTDSDPSNITALTYDQLTASEKAVVAGLFKWWAADCLTLDKETYGVDFNSDTAMVNEIGLYFYTDNDSTTLAAVNNAQRPSDGYGEMLYLNVNMRFYGNVDSSDLNGEGKYTDSSGKEHSGGFLDRTLAHEFVHAIMSSNVNFFHYLPQFITEGTAELSHGIDDERATTIFNLAFDSDALANSMIFEPGTGNSASYASGYMFLRYFARQATLQTLTAPALGDITANVNLANFNAGDVLYADDSGNVSTDNSGILLGQVATDVQGDLYYQVYDSGVKQIVTTSATIPDVYGVTANVKLSGNDGYDGVEVVEGATEVNTGGGDDLVQVKGQYATINTGAGDDQVYISDGGHNKIDLGDGNNYLEIQGAPYIGNGYLIAYNYGNSITGGTGNDILTNGANVVYVDSEGNLYSESVAGATAYNFRYSNNEFKVDLGDGNNKIALNYVYDSDLKTGAGMDFVVIDYAANVNIDTGETTDLVSVGGGTGNLIDTGDGKDYVAMRMNSSTVNSGAGDDYVVFGTLNDSLFADSYTILNSNLIDLGDGIDQIDFAGSNNTIIGGADNDYIQQISGGAGNNAYHFSGEFGTDTIKGFMSNDMIHIAAGNTAEFANNVLTVKKGSVVKGTIEFVNGSFTTSNVVADLAAEVEPVPLTADEQGNYLINSVDDLTTLATYVNNGNTCAGLTFKLTANIDIADAAVMNNFAGTFDGGGHLFTNADQNIFGDATVSDLYYHGAATIDGATKVYTLELPDNVTASDALEFDGNDYYNGNVTLTIGTGAALGNVTGIDNVAADSNGQVTFDIASDVTITDANIFYAVTVNGATISGNSISVNGTDYYNGEVTATTETGYTVDSPVIVDKATEITATLDTANHYVFGNATDGYTLATVDNTKDYPELVQVYELTLPNNVIASGEILAFGGGKRYMAGEITLSALDGYLVENITVNGESDDDGVFTINSNTTITADVTVGGYLDGGLKWELIDGTLTVSGNGAIPNYNDNDNPLPWYHEEITSVVVESGVTSIGRLAFYDCANLSSVTVPASVTNIASDAFDSCTNLQAVNIAVPSGKTLIVDGEVLEGGGTINLKPAIDASGNSVEIVCVTIGTDGEDFGDGFKWIFSGGTLIISGEGDMPDFAGSADQPWKDKNVKKVIISDGVTSIGNSAFENCRSLSSITIPDGVTSIGNSAFENCRSLSSITIPDGVTSIGESAFYTCQNLSSVTLPASVKSIGGSAFYGCSDDLSVKVAVSEGKSVFINGTEYPADEDGFADITEVALQFVEFNLTYGDPVPEQEITWDITDGVLTVSGTGAMDNYNRNGNLAPWSSRRAEITSVVVESGITSIGDYAFYNLTNLQSVTLPASVTSIGDYAFAYAENLQSVTLPASVTSIGNYVFAYAENLQSVTLPASVTSIGNHAFLLCENLETAAVTVPEGQHIVIGDKISSDSGTVNIAEQLKDGVAFRVTAAPVEEVTYTDENGKSQTVLAFVLDNSTADLGNGTYVVKGNVTFDDTLNFAGDAKIILGDGATLTVNGDDYGIYCKGNGDLSIYGTGTLNATATKCGIEADIITIAGGTVTSNAEISGSVIYLDGGKVTAPSVTAESLILLDWLNTDDFFNVGTYTAEDDAVFIGKKFYNGDTVYSGTEASPLYSQYFGKQVYMLTADQIAALNGVKLNAFAYYTFSAPEGVDITCNGETRTLDGVTYYKHGAKISVTAPEGKTLLGTDGKFFTGSKTFTVAGDIVLTEPPIIGDLTIDADGNGTYELSTPQHLVALSEYVNEGNDCAGLNFKLTADIDMSNVEFAPIGWYDENTYVACSFAGTFDGGGHVIRNLTIDSEEMVVGLFGVNNGLVQNVVLDGFDITGTVAVAGIVALNNMGAVTNCATLDGTISGGSMTGAIVGVNNGDVLNNYCYGELAAIAANSADESNIANNARIYLLDLPENVTAQGALKFGEKYYATADTTITLKAANGYTLGNVTVNGTPDDDGVFTVSGDTNITAELVYSNEFNAAGTGVIVGGTSGDFSANSGVYSIKASQQNSTLIGNAKNNTVIIAGGGENILTGGLGNDSFKFSAGGGIVTDYGIGATKNGDGTTATANGVDVVKVDGKVNGIYFEREGNTKKFATFTATIVYGDNNDVIVLKDIVKKPTKTGSSPIYQTNDVAAATLKIWDTSGSKQAVLSAAKLKKLFHDDNDDAFTGILKDKTNYLVDISKGLTPATNPFATQLTFTGGNKH